MNPRLLLTVLPLFTAAALAADLPAIPPQPIENDTMRVTLDGRPVAFLKSSGIAHPTKSKVEFGRMGHDGFFDDIKIWNAEPATPRSCLVHGGHSLER